MNYHDDVIEQLMADETNVCSKINAMIGKLCALNRKYVKIDLSKCYSFSQKNSVLKSLKNEMNELEKDICNELNKLAEK